MYTESDVVPHLLPKLVAGCSALLPLIRISAIFMDKFRGFSQLRNILVHISQAIFYMLENLTTWGLRLCFPSEERRAANFYVP
jgi:hypothetical protein